MLERMFRLSERGSDVRTEVVAGLATFMTMAYIIFVNPAILAAGGVPFSAAVTATCIAAAAATLIMGLATNYPFALASGMGLNAFLVFGVILAMGLPWQVGMAVVFIEGIIILLLVLTGLREAVMHAIPLSLKQAIGVGIGLGFVSYTLIKMARGKFREVHPLLYVVSVAFAVTFVIHWINGLFGSL
jgi:AGZA family xanthine/uracil permease-like MFS transporter